MQRPDQIRHSIAVRNVLFALAYPETFDPPLTASERYRCVEAWNELRRREPPRTPPPAPVYVTRVTVDGEPRLFRYSTGASWMVDGWRQQGCEVWVEYDVEWDGTTYVDDYAGD